MHGGWITARLHPGSWMSAAMSTEGPRITGSAATSPLAFLTAPGAAAETAAEAASPVPVLVALACIFLVLATCLLFMVLCKPAALDPRRRGAREFMPHHPGSPSEPQLRLWKRLGSLRRSLRTFSFRRGRPAAPRCPLPACDLGCTESTKM